jgi:hypothetical protein
MSTWKRSLAALALALPLASPAAVTVELGHVTVVKGSSGDLPFSFTLDDALTVIALDAWIGFDTQNIAFDADAPLFGSLSLNGLGALPDWEVGLNAAGIVITGAPDDPFTAPWQMAAGTLSGTLRFTGLRTGVTPVSLHLEVCDLDSCFFGDPILPLVADAAGSVTVSVVPEPAPWLLLAGGLLALGRLAPARRR